MMDLLTNTPAILFYIFIVVYAILSHLMMQSFEERLRLFETDADLADKNYCVENRRQNQQVDPSKLIFVPKTKNND